MPNLSLITSGFFVCLLVFESMIHLHYCKKTVDTQNLIKSREELPLKKTVADTTVSYTMIAVLCPQLSCGLPFCLIPTGPLPPSAAVIGRIYTRHVDMH